MSTPPRPQASSEAADADGDSATAARRRAAHEQIISRQSTVEFISSLLGGTDTPDAPLEQKFESLPSTAAEMTALAESTPLAAAAKIKARDALQKELKTTFEGQPEPDWDVSSSSSSSSDDEYEEGLEDV